MNFEKSDKMSNIGHRIMEEVRAYAVISLYLWFCFGSLLLYKESIMYPGDTAFLPFGTAVVKALVIGKVILISKALKVGGRAKIETLLYRIAWRSLAILFLLLIFTVFEELVVGLVHRQSLHHILTEFTEHSWLQYVAHTIIMLLILVPMIAFGEIDNVLGKGKLKRMLLDTSSSS